jgi:amino acid adenylation domain-containing protein
VIAVTALPRTLSEIVSRSADKHGGRPAVLSGPDRLSWHQLDRRCGQLSTVLAKCFRVGRGDRVALFLPKSVNSMVAVHGTFRSGAAYVPIDPLSPPSHVASILRDASPKVVISDQRVQRTLDAALQLLRDNNDSVPAIIGPDVANAELTTAWSWEHVSQVDPSSSVISQPDDLAYVMYTSGSTGKPKGITHTHSSGLAYASRAVETYSVTENDRLANSAPLHFDISTFELLAGPLAGACSLLIPEPYLKMPASLSQLLADESVTFWYSVPSLLSELAARGALEKRNLESIRWVLFGGEVVSPAVLRTLMNHWPQARFSNIYGPAEVNQCTYYHLPDVPSNDDQVPIGYQWDGAEIDIVDDTGLPLPSGVVGELVVNTPTMMAGYWKRSDLTDASIKPHASLPGTWYWTGDLASKDSDGLLHFHGRRDNQVKVRGNRVELESVEAALSEAPHVLHAVVAVRGSGIEARLIAQVMLAPGSSPQAIEIIRNAATRLPSYAVPDEVQFAESFPLTPSGKIDKASIRKLLQATPLDPTAGQQSQSPVSTLSQTTLP